MRIINRKEFLSMPKGTVYSHYVPQVADGLMVKYETLTNDWVYQDLLFNVAGETSEEASEKLTDAEERGASFILDLHCGSRDGMYDDNQLFMVYEKEDVKRLIKKLIEAALEVL
jgi:hypothetical protein